MLEKDKNNLYILSAFLGFIALIGLLIHSWETQHVKQKYLLLSQIIALTSIILGFPYIWKLKLQRIKFIVFAVIYLMSVLLLLKAFF